MWTFFHNTHEYVILKGGGGGHHEWHALGSSQNLKNELPKW
jgi:hypothetical protein